MSDTKSQDVTPYLTMDNCKEAHEWYTKHFDGKILRTSTFDPSDGKISHSVLELPNNAQIYMSDRFDKSSKEGSSSESVVLTKEQKMSAPFSMHLQFGTVEDGQRFWDKATCETNGTKVTMKFEKQFWGDTFGKFFDPFGFSWSVGSSPAEEGKRKKRTLSEAQATESKSEKDEVTSPSKKRKRGESHGQKFDIIECQEKHGLFREYKVGTNTGYDFGKAAKEGFEALLAFMGSNHLTPSCRGSIFVCPENPFEFAVVRCFPGMIFDKTAHELQTLAKAGDGMVAKTIPAGKYLVAMHVGSYDGLAVKWQALVKEFKKKGYKVTDTDGIYEEYLNNCGEVPEEKLETRLYMPIAPESL